MPSGMMPPVLHPRIMPHVPLPQSDAAIEVIVKPLIGASRRYAVNLSDKIASFAARVAESELGNDFTLLAKGKRIYGHKKLWEYGAADDHEESSLGFMPGNRTFADHGIGHGDSIYLEGRQW